MVVWLVLGLLTLLVMGVLYWSLSHRGQAQVGHTHVGDDPAYDRAIYRDQLAELDRDVASGMISTAEADAARNEISRRLLLAESAPQKPGTVWAFAPLFTLLIPLVALPVYLSQGNPQIADVPLQARLDSALVNKDMPAIVTLVEKRLATNPDEIQGWQLVVPVYRQEARWDAAAKAYQNLIRLSPPNADLQADYAEALALASNGDFSADAREALKQAVRIDPNNPKAGLLQALALKQEGKSAEAASLLQKLLATAPSDAPYRGLFQSTIQSLTSGDDNSLMPGPSLDQMAAGAAATPQQRATMINGMIEGLEKRLGDHAADLEGWKRLIRARMVNNQPDKAKVSLAKARVIFKDKPQAIADINNFAQQQGLE